MVADVGLSTVALPVLARPIRLVVADIDGCLVAVEHASYDLDRLAALRALSSRSGSDQEAPQLTLLSGRPHAYVDALMQVLDIRLPAIFENGAGMAVRWPYKTLFRPEADLARDSLTVLTHELQGRSDVAIQPGKSASLTVFPADAGAGIKWVEAMLIELIDDRSLGLVVDPAQECVNVLLPGVNKALGLRWLAEELGMSPTEIAGIGDSVGDLGWLMECGLSHAPANASRLVRDSVDNVSAYENIGAVLELFDVVIRANRALARR